MSVPEDTPVGQVICPPTALTTIDVDSTKFTYSIIPFGNYSVSPTQPGKKGNVKGDGYPWGFTISSSTGAITVGNALNFENKAHYLLYVNTIDYGLNDKVSADPMSQPLSSISALDIDITPINHQPILTPENQYFVAEASTASTVVGYVAMRGQDKGQAHFYSLGGTDRSLQSFGIESDGNRRAIIYRQGLGNLDFEVTPLQLRPLVHS